MTLSPEGMTQEAIACPLLYGIAFGISAIFSARRHWNFNKLLMQSLSETFKSHSIITFSNPFLAFYLPTGQFNTNTHFNKSLTSVSALISHKFFQGHKTLDASPQSSPWTTHRVNQPIPNHFHGTTFKNLMVWSLAFLMFKINILPKSVTWRFDVPRTDHHEVLMSVDTHISTLLILSTLHIFPMLQQKSQIWSALRLKLTHIIYGYPIDINDVGHVFLDWLWPIAYAIGFVLTSQRSNDAERISAAQGVSVSNQDTPWGAHCNSCDDARHRLVFGPKSTWDSEN